MARGATVNDNDYLKLQWHLDMMKAARERWPEMVEEPRIVGASPGVDALIVPVLDEPQPVLPLKRLLREKWCQEDAPTWRQERIDLEQVGPYRLGYGPQSRVLYVGACCMWAMSITSHSRQRSTSI
jgi:hypothetical protein